MIDERERYERAFQQFQMTEPAWEILVDRRDRKRRNQRIAAGVVGIAVFVAAVWIVMSGVPFDRTETPAIPGAAGNGPALDPFISINAQLSVDHPAVDLFKVQTSDPQYWQLSTLDQFDGEGWRRSDPDGSDGQTVTGRIVGSGDDAATVEVDGARREVPYADVAKALVQVEFNRKDKPDDGED